MSPPLLNLGWVGGGGGAVSSFLLHTLPEAKHPPPPQQWRQGYSVFHTMIISPATWLLTLLIATGQVVGFFISLVKKEQPQDYRKASFHTCHPASCILTVAIPLSTLVGSLWCSQPEILQVWRRPPHEEAQRQKSPASPRSLWTELYSTAEPKCQGSKFSARSSGDRAVTLTAPMDDQGHCQLAVWLQVVFHYFTAAKEWASSSLSWLG